MSKLLRITIFSIFIIIAFCMVMTSLFLFVVLVLIGGLSFFFLKYFAKLPSNKGTTKGIVIEHEQVVNDHLKKNTIPPSILKADDGGERVSNKPITDAKDPVIHKMFYFSKLTVEDYPQSPNNNGAEIIEGLIKFTSSDSVQNSIKANALRLLSEMHEAMNDYSKALEPYKMALAFNEKVGVKRETSQLQNLNRVKVNHQFFERKTPL